MAKYAESAVSGSKWTEYTKISFHKSNGTLVARFHEARFIDDGESVQSKDVGMFSLVLPTDNSKFNLYDPVTMVKTGAKMNYTDFVSNLLSLYLDSAKARDQAG